MTEEILAAESRFFKAHKKLTRKLKRASDTLGELIKEADEDFKRTKPLLSEAESPPKPGAL
jgi:hypothetical protein